MTTVQLLAGPDYEIVLKERPQAVARACLLLMEKVAFAEQMTDEVKEA